MKKLSIYLLLAIAAMMGFSSCEDEDALEPTLQLSSEGDFIADDMTVEPGSTIKFAWRAQKGDGKLKTFTIMASNNFKTDKSGKTWNGEEEIPSASNENYLDTAMFNAPDGDGDVITYTFTVTDNNDETATETVKITAEQTGTTPAGSLKPVISGVKIYCTVGDGTGKSTCASIDGTTYAPASASTSEQEKIDFVYFYQSSTGIYAPDATPSVLDDAFTSWTVKNSTKFGKVTTDFSTVTYDDVVSLTDGLSSSSLTGLEANDVVAFKTEDGSRGVFQVSSIEPGFNADDYIVINIKVEE